MNGLAPARAQGGARLRPRPAFTVGRDSRATPPEVYECLNAEFAFTLDPCPLDTSATAGAPLWGKDGLARSWTGERVFCNPPYSNIEPWMAKAREAEVAVYLVPVKSDLRWWHRHVMTANEVRFFRGRLRFIGMSGGAPFPSVVVVFRGPSPSVPVWRSIERPPRAPLVP